MQEGKTMRNICRLFFVGVFLFLFAACSSGTTAHIKTNKLTLEERGEGKYAVYLQYSSLFYTDVQEQFYANLMELMRRADALADTDMDTDYVLAVRLKEYNNVSMGSRVLYGIYGGKDIMESEVAVVRFDSLKTDEYRDLLNRPMNAGLEDIDLTRKTISHGAESIFKMEGSHLIKADLRTEQRMPEYLAPIDLIRMHSEKIVRFILTSEK
jgi:hypothetical protein